MTEDMDVPDEDNPYYWGPIIDQLLEDRANLHSYMFETRQYIAVWGRDMIRAAERRVFRRAEQFGDDWTKPIIGKVVSPPPRNAATAGLLKQSNHAMREEIKEVIRQTMEGLLPGKRPITSEIKEKLLENIPQPGEEWHGFGKGWKRWPDEPESDRSR
jgi:hypothetical protein